MGLHQSPRGNGDQTILDNIVQPSGMMAQLDNPSHTHLGQARQVLAILQIIRNKVGKEEHSGAKATLIRIT